MIMKRFVRFSIIVILVCILTSGCKSIRESRISNHKETLTQAGFDRDYWINDTLGCNPDKKGKNSKLVYSGLIDPSFRVIDPSAGGNNPEGRSLLNMQ